MIDYAAILPGVIVPHLMAYGLAVTPCLQQGGLGRV